MKNNRGYTVPELIVVIAVVGIFSMIAIFKTSYAFSDAGVPSNDEINNNLIVAQAVKYGESNKDKFGEKNEFIITVKELADAKYLSVSEDGKILSSDKDLSNISVKIKLKDDKVTASIVK